MNRTLDGLVVIALGAAVSCSGCSRDPAIDSPRYQLTGVVVGREPSPPRIVVAHDPVATVMPAMSMPFEVVGEAPALREGDRILATLVVTGSRSWLEDVRVTARDGLPGSPLAADSRATPGAIVPGFSLVDQDGRQMRLHEAANRVRIVTFIYTRCPLPDFCPLMVRHLETVRQRVNERGLGARLALLGITLDPEFDSPAVLRAYGESVLKGPGPFSQWTLATGTAAQVEDVARFFGVASRTEGGFVTHTLATAVIGHDGRVMRTFASNAWRPDELLDIVVNGLEYVSGGLRPPEPPYWLARGAPTPHAARQARSLRSLATLKAVSTHFRR